jgi:hypothetical protein
MQNEQELFTEYRAATAAHVEASRAMESARSVETACRDRVNKAQKALRIFMDQLAQEAHHGTDWKRETSRRVAE